MSNDGWKSKDGKASKKFGPFILRVSCRESVEDYTVQSARWSVHGSSGTKYAGGTIQTDPTLPALKRFAQTEACSWLEGLKADISTHLGSKWNDIGPIDDVLTVKNDRGL